MFAVTTIYIRHVLISIVLFTSMLSIELFNLTLLYSFLGCFFEYSPLFIPYRFSVYNLQGLRVSRRFGLVPSLIHQYKGTNHFWKFCGLVEGFNKSRRQIASGVEKLAD